MFVQYVWQLMFNACEKDISISEFYIYPFQWPLMWEYDEDTKVMRSEFVNKIKCFYLTNEILMKSKCKFTARL